MLVPPRLVTVSRVMLTGLTPTIQAESCQQRQGDCSLAKISVVPYEHHQDLGRQAKTTQTVTENQARKQFGERPRVDQSASTSHRWNVAGWHDRLSFASFGPTCSTLVASPFDTEKSMTWALRCNAVTRARHGIRRRRWRQVVVATESGGGASRRLRGVLLRRTASLPWRGVCVRTACKAICGRA